MKYEVTIKVVVEANDFDHAEVIARQDAFYSGDVVMISPVYDV